MLSMLSDVLHVALYFQAPATGPEPQSGRRDEAPAATPRPEKRRAAAPAPARTYPAAINASCRAV
jgi:hypothetical protein